MKKRREKIATPAARDGSNSKTVARTRQPATVPMARCAARCHVTKVSLPKTAATAQTGVQYQWSSPIDNAMQPLTLVATAERSA